MFVFMAVLFAGNIINTVSKSGINEHFKKKISSLKPKKRKKRKVLCLETKLLDR